ncbi:MAG: hypothetical protein U1E27_05085 [Kiritimatiellia bacterium]|nr:hypothetical protein [Kiritimatiellia bacterium]
MEAFWAEALSVLSRAALQPADSADWGIAAGAWLIGGLLTMKIMGAILNNPNESLKSNLAVGVIGGTGVLAAATAASLWVASDAGSIRGAAGVTIAAAIAAVLLLATPLLKLIQRVSYITAVLTLGVSIAAAALLHLAARTTADGIRAGQNRMGGVESRTETLNRDLVE